MLRRRLTRRPRKVVRRRGLRRRTNAKKLSNPRPVFTETYKAKELTFDVSGAGYQATSFIFAATMDGLAQLPQYSNLYQKYRILKAEWLLLPNWTGGEQQNAAIYNYASGPVTPPGLTSVGTTRVVYAINDTPNLQPPAAEQDVLQDNGCRIRFLDKMIKIKNRPVPNIEDAQGNWVSMRGKFINFTNGTPNDPHYGVSGWISQPVSVGSTGNSGMKIDVYCKLTFQLADPK